jgi:hypothetical protein
MRGISEEDDEENDLNLSLEKQQEEEAIRSFLQQEGHGLNMDDLRAIQDRLMETALLRSQGAKLYNGKEEASSTRDEQVASASAPDAVQPGLLASPFIGQHATTSFISTPAANSKSSLLMSIGKALTSCFSQSGNIQRVNVFPTSSALPQRPPRQIFPSSSKFSSVVAFPATSAS